MMARHIDFIQKDSNSADVMEDIKKEISTRSFMHPIILVNKQLIDDRKDKELECYTGTIKVPTENGIAMFKELRQIVEDMYILEKYENMYPSRIYPNELYRIIVIK